MVAINGSQFRQMMQAQRTQGQFQRLDTNSDGKLSTDELSALAEHISQRTGRQVDPQQLLQRMDQDGDGAVNLSELGDARSAAMQRRQAQMTGGRPPRPPHPDTNRDGKIDDNELAVMAQRISQRTGQEVSVDELKQRLDRNGDGELTRADGPPHPMHGGQRPYGVGEDSSEMQQDLMNTLNQFRMMF